MPLVAETFPQMHSSPDAWLCRHFIALPRPNAPARFEGRIQSRLTTWKSETAQVTPSSFDQRHRIRPAAAIGVPEHRPASTWRSKMKAPFVPGVDAVAGRRPWRYHSGIMTSPLLEPAAGEI